MMMILNEGFQVFLSANIGCVSIQGLQQTLAASEYPTRMTVSQNSLC